MFEMKGMFLAPFHLNAGQPQPLDRFEQNLYQKLQIIILLSTSKPELRHAPNYNNSYLSVKLLLLLDQNLVLNMAVEAYSLNYSKIECENYHSKINI